MVAYYLADSPGQRSLAARLGVALPQLCDRSFSDAHRQVVAELAFAVADTFSDGDQSAASLFAETLLAVVGWQEPTDLVPGDRSYVAGPVRHGEHYAVIRLDYQPTETPIA